MTTLIKEIMAQERDETDERALEYAFHHRRRQERTMVMIIGYPMLRQDPEFNT